MIPEDHVDQIRRAYPARLGHQNWERLRTLIPRLHFTWGVSWETLLKAATNYRIMNERMGKVGSEFVMPAGKFYDDRDRLFAEYADMDMRTPAELAADRASEALQARAARIGFRASLPGEPSFRYEEALKEAERALQPRAEPKFQVIR